MRQTTLCYPIMEGRVLLAMKKRGFGQGHWNGPGGKVEAGETTLEACIRETREEVCLEISQVEPRGVIEFVFEGKPEWDNRCDVFVATAAQGEAQETEEMLPRWFLFSEVPYAEMWEDDVVWLPQVLAGGRVERRFYFDAEGHLLRHEAL